MKWKSNFLIFDFETTGYSGKENQACQIAFIVKDIEMNELERFSSYIQEVPGRKINQSALDFNKITREMMAGGITYQNVYLKLVQVFKKYNVGKRKISLVGHNIDVFDIPFLENIFEVNKDNVWNYISDSTFDTMSISRLKWGNIDVSDHKLGSAMERAGVLLTNAHDAMGDVEGNTELFEFYVKCLRGTGTSNQDSLQKEEVKFQF